MLVVGEQDATEMVVCGTCGELRGPWRSKGGRRGRFRTQGCACLRGDAEPWPGFDYQTVMELCHVCGAEALPSGSRWSLYHCAACKWRVIALNRQSGRCAIPIGRHSIMNGIFLDRGRDAAALTFADALLAFAASHDDVLDWRRRQVSTNLAACGLAGRAAVPLPDYLAACAALPVDKALAFEGLVRQYGPEPEGPGRDGRA